MKRILFFFLLTVIPSDHLFAQQLAPRGKFVLNLDYARFRNDAQSAYFEIYYGFYPNLLQYNLSNGSYQAGIKVGAKLINNATQTLAIQKNVLLPVVITDTSSAAYRFPFTTQTGHVIPFGEYTLKVVAADSLNPSQRDSVSLPISIQAYPEAVAMSDLELCSRLQASDKKDDLFFKNSLEVVPNPSLVFGIATHPVLFNYVEIYHLNPDAAYTMKTQVVAADGKVIKETAKTRRYGVKNGIEAAPMNVTAIMPGKYTFRLLLLDDKAQELTRAEKTFFIFNPHLQAQSAGPGGASFQAAQLSGLSAAELDAEFQQARYYATSQEVKMYEQIETEMGKREFLTKFWSEVEAGRLERPPIKRTDYLRRAATATQLYSFLNKEGWRTDRGRVYLLYGEPDHVVRFPSDGNAKPYQTWYYYRIEKGVEFVFVDRLGNGDYQLVHSTKRGELQDETWQSYLQ